MFNVETPFPFQVVKQRSHNLLGRGDGPHEREEVANPLFGKKNAAGGFACDGAAVDVED